MQGNQEMIKCLNAIQVATNKCICQMHACVCVCVCVCVYVYTHTRLNFKWKFEFFGWIEFFLANKFTGNI